jgi:hypothetical protein
MLFVAMQNEYKLFSVIGVAFAYASIIPFCLGTNNGENAICSGEIARSPMNGAAMWRWASRPP